MDTRTGEIYTPEEVEVFKRYFGKKRFNNDPEFRFMKIMEVPPTEKQMERKPPKVGRNEPCPCRSSKKFKRCCLNAIS